MAHLFRVALLLCLALVSGLASAYPAPIWYYNVYPPGPNYPTSEAACRAAFDFFSTEGNGTFAFTGVLDVYPGVECRGTKTLNGVTEIATSNAREVYVCPDPKSHLSGSECVCSSDSLDEDGQCKPKPEICEPGYHKEGDVCVIDECKPNEIRVNNVCVKEPDCPPGKERVNGVCKDTGCQAGKNVGYRGNMSENETAYFCAGGCQARAKASICVSWDGKTECGGDAILTGARCMPGSDNPPPKDPGPNDTPPPDDDNPPQEGDGGGNGDGGDGPGSGGGGGDGPGSGGSGDGPGGGGDGNPGSGPGDGPGDGPGNGPGGESGMSQPNQPVEPDENDECPDGYHKQGKLCIEDPKPPDQDGKCSAGFVKVGNMCYATYKPGDPNGDPNGEGEGDGEKDAFGGTCDTGFTCKGDVIQCAIAQEQHRRACQLYVLKTAESKLYLTESVKTGNRTLDLPGNETIDLNGRIDVSDALGGGAGVQDLNITVAGQSITLPLSVLNSPLAILGNILVAISFLLAFRIVGRG